MGHRRPIDERLWERVDRRGSDECWPWTGNVNTTGYGQIGLGGRNCLLIGTHVAAWQATSGQRVPTGFVVRHSCDNKLCCNPGHLSIGTPLQNSRDAVERGRTPREFRNASCVLSDDDVACIRRAYMRPSHNESNAKLLAATFGVTTQHIQSIVAGRRRSHAAVA